MADGEQVPRFDQMARQVVSSLEFRDGEVKALCNLRETISHTDSIPFRRLATVSPPPLRGRRLGPGWDTVEHLLKTGFRPHRDFQVVFGIGRRRDVPSQLRV